jgi:hypothetical protein
MNAVTLAELKEIISPDSERRHREMMAATIAAGMVQMDLYRSSSRHYMEIAREASGLASMIQAEVVATEQGADDE